MDAPGSALASKNVTRLEHEGKVIYIIGTAHISQRSVEEVERVITELEPDSVCVELDATRYEAMVDGSRWRKLDVFEILRQKRALFFLTSLLLTAYQRRLGEKLGVRPGAEMLAAVRKAAEVGAALVLADRDIHATLKRSFHNLSFWNKCQLVGVMVAVSFANHEMSEEQIEELKDRDTIGEMMRAFACEMPELQGPLIDERDRYLMSSVQESPGATIVAVVGAGHVEGMVRYLGQSADRDALSALPPPTATARALKWLIPVIVVGAFVWGYREHSVRALEQMLYAWTLPTSIGAGVLAAAAGGRPLTILAALASSPITSLSPKGGAGTVAGLVEGWLRRPTVDECERLNQDMMSLRGVYRNPFTHVLLVTLATTVGSVIGSWIGVYWILTLL